MGGVIARELVLDHLSQRQLANLKGLCIIASPLQGSTIKDEVMMEMRTVGPFFNHFLRPTFEAMDSVEMLQHFYESSFKQSKSSYYVSRADDFDIKNKTFVDMAVPYKLFAEDVPTHLKVVGKDYFFVQPDKSKFKADDVVVRIPGMTHHMVQRIDSVDSPIV